MPVPYHGAMSTNATETPLWWRAAGLAARRHEHQYRKDGVTPYVTHVMRVTMTLATVFDVRDETILAAALLHDVIEDTPADYDDVAECCGSEVADLVAAMSKDMRLPDGEKNEAYFEQLARAPWPARLLKLADIYDNLHDVRDEHARRRAIDTARRTLAICEGDERLASARQIVEAVMDRVATGKLAE